MKPLSWLFLYISFFSIIIIFNMLNYFIFINKPQKKNNISKNINETLNWKW